MPTKARPWSNSVSVFPSTHPKRQSWRCWNMVRTCTSCIIVCKWNKLDIIKKKWYIDITCCLRSTMFDANVNPIEPFRPFCESIAAYSFKRYKSDLILSGLLLISIWMKISCCKWPRNATNCCTFGTRASCQSNMSCSYFYNMFLSIARFATGLLCRPTKSKSPGNRRRLRRPEAGTFLGNLGRIYEVDNPKSQSWFMH